MKLLAVDGNSILNRAYYGIRLLSTKDGAYTNGIYGFLTILLRMEQEVKPDAVAITFDMREPTFRHKKYEGYKAQRKGMPDELAQQMPPLKDLLKHLGYPIVQLAGYEADDLLGTLARGACESGNSCVIATGDRDSFQLIDDCVTVRLASTKGGKPMAELWDEAAIREKYGVDPIQLIDVKALMGDSSDNVPGVAGVGEKTALALIHQYQGLAYIYDHLDELDIRDTLKSKLRGDKEMALLSRELVTIDRNAPIDAKTESYKRREPDNAAAYRLMARLEMFSLMERFGVKPGDAPAPEDAAAAARPEDQALDIFCEAPVEDWLAGVKQVDFLCVFAGDVPATVCIRGAEALYLYDASARDVLGALLQSPLPKRTSHLKQLYRYALKEDIPVLNMVFDAEIAGYILNPTANDYSVGRLAAEYGVSAQQIAPFLGEYGDLLQDLACFTGLADALSDKLSENSQVLLFREIELPLAKVLASMELLGFAVDTDGLRDYGKMLDTEIARHQSEIYRLAGEEFNINSPKQLGVILFEKLGLPAKKKTKTGYSTNAEVLEGLLGGHDIIRSILDYRQVAKLKSTYVDGLLAQVQPDGRIHTTFQQTLTRTGRISSTEPNLQNIPIRTALGSELRRFFRARQGDALLDADYSQIELRVLAHIAGDKNMIAAFQSGEDIHRNTAAQVFGLPPELVTPGMRSSAKAVNFGIVYGIGAFSLSRDIGVTVSEADRYIKSYLATYSGVRAYMDDTVEFGKKHGYVQTMFRRRRYLPELSSSNRAMREFGKRVAMNTPIQGAAADIIKIAMVRVWERLAKENLRARLILQVHDELIVECPPDEVEAVTRCLHEEMENAAALRVPLVAEVGRGESWFDAK